MSEKSHVGMNCCYYCGEKFEVLIHKQLKKVFPHRIPPQHLGPCGKCKDYMKKGIILIGVDEEKSDMEQFERDKHSWDEARSSSNETFGTPRYEMDMKRAGFNPYMPPQKHLYRSGHFLVVSENFILNNIQPPEVVDMIMKKRFSFIPKEMVISLNKQFEELKK